MAKIYLIDVTNRDGVQTARIGLSKFQKTMLNVYLAKFGVYQSEMGFPFLRHEDNYIRANLALKEKGALGDMVLGGWCRAIPEDVKKALPLGIRDFNLSISTSDQMIVNKFKGKLDRETVIKEMVEAVNLAVEGGARTIGVNAEDASRTDMEYLKRFAAEAKAAGAQRIRYCDTIGRDTPESIYKRIHELALSVQIPIELHCHNDLGMAVANSLAGARAAVDAGVDAYINTTVNGIGERAGQADLLTTVLAIKFGAGYEDYELGDDIDLTVGYKISEYGSYAFKIPIPINQPGVGANAFAHEAGIHADGALKDRHNYELYDYTLIGRQEEYCAPTGRVITTGEYGGMAGFLHVCQQLDVTFEDEKEAMPYFILAQYVNMQNQLPLRDEEIKFLIEHPEETKLLLTIEPEATIHMARLRKAG